MMRKLLACLLLATKYFIYICGFVCIFIVQRKGYLVGLGLRGSQVMERNSGRYFTPWLGFSAVEC